jgi:hypothetical protein
MLAGNVADMSRHVGTTRRVAPILARWVPVADTKLKMAWQFVSARADIYQIFRSAYVEIYYGMGVHMHRYYRTHMLSTLISVMFSPVGLSCSPSLSCSPTDYQKVAGDNTHPHNTDKNREHSQFNYTMNSAPQHHPPMPPTKAIGAITQNRRGHPTATP